MITTEFKNAIKELLSRITIPLIVFCCGVYAEDVSKSFVFDKDTILNGSIVVDENTTCVVKAGVTIRFGGYYRFIIQGLLIAEGTSAKPIIMTGVDRPHGSSDKPCWQGLEITGEKANAVLKFCRIEGAYRSFVFNAAPTIENCEFVGNHCAIYCSNKAAPNIKSNKIYRNKYGIVAEFASPMVLDNVITENDIGVLMMRSSRLIAGRNVISGNKKDMHSETSFGENFDALSLKHIWDLMNQLY